MILFSLALIFRAKDGYDIISPIKETKTGEINFWTMMGVTTNLKKSIHFSSKVNATNSAMCHRIPTSSKIWNALLDFKLNRGSLNFSYTTNLCPYKSNSSDEEYWRGFYINIKENNGKSDVSYFAINKEGKEISDKLCTIESETKMLIGLENNTVTIITDSGECGKPFHIDHTSYGFFSITNFPNKKLGEAIIKSLKITLPENFTESFDVDLINHLSRSHIRKMNEKEKVFKVQYSIKTLESLLDNHKSEEFTQKTSQILAELELAINRTLSTDQMKALIESKIRKRLAKLEKKIGKRRQTLHAVQDGLGDIRSYVENSIVELRSYLYQLNLELAKDSKNTVMRVLNISDTDNVVNKTSEFVENHRNGSLSVILFVICALELSCYVAFFLERHKRTDGFKKHD